MKRTIFIATTGIVCLALITAAHAQQSTCITTRDVSGAYISQCTTNQGGGITHRYVGPSRAEQDYNQRAYEYELRRLEQENRR